MAGWRADCSVGWRGPTCLPLLVVVLGVRDGWGFGCCFWFPLLVGLQLVFVLWFGIALSVGYSLLGSFQFGLRFGLVVLQVGLVLWLYCWWLFTDLFVWGLGWLFLFCSCGLVTCGVGRVWGVGVRVRGVW